MAAARSIRAALVGDTFLVRMALVGAYKPAVAQPGQTIIAAFARTQSRWAAAAAAAAAARLGANAACLQAQTSGWSGQTLAASARRLN